MESKIFDRAGQLFRTEMPEADSLDGYITAILPKVRPWSEDLREEQFYIARPWMEIRDDDSFHKLILHFFNAENEYIKSVDGEVEVGSWRHQNNKLMIMDKDGEEGELFDLTYLDGQFFILRKSGGKGYLFLALEPIGRPLKDRWLDLIEMLFKKSQSNISFYIIIAVAILLALAILLVLR